MNKKIELPTTGAMDEHELVMRWLAEERPYQIDKFAGGQDDPDGWRHNDEALSTEGVGEGTYWEQQLTNYVHRLGVLGLDLPNGRQALMKFVSTAVGLAEAMVRVYGPPPRPGVPSGQGLDEEFE